MKPRKGLHIFPYMSYKNICTRGLGNNKFAIHLWTDEGYEYNEFKNYAYTKCHPSKATHKGLKGEALVKTFDFDRNDPNLHYHDIPIHQKFLIDKYGTEDTPSTTHREVFFDIEIEMGGALTPEYIQSAPKPVTSIAYWDRQEDKWVILILDSENQLSHIKGKTREIYPLEDEKTLLKTFIKRLAEIKPNILCGYNSDYFDIPYLYYRIKNVLGKKAALQLSPINYVKELGEHNPDQPIKIQGIASLDYMRMHKKYSFKDEPSYKLDALGKKYAGLEKIEYNGSLDRLFKEDIETFINYNFRDVEILKALDEKFNYIGLTKNLAHKGKIMYDEVYVSSKIHDGAISAYLLEQGIIPPSRDRNPLVKKNYAGGYLFCPQAGIYKYMFDLDLTSLYPSIIMSLNIGKETYVGRVLDLYDDRNNRLGLNDLKAMDSDKELLVENPKGEQKYISVSEVISRIEKGNLSISANGVMYRTDRKSVLSTILSKWFDERVEYKNKMKQAYKVDNDPKMGEYWHLRQYTMKILLNSLYGATALKSFRYGNVILSESITLSGQRIIQESALFTNRHMNHIMKKS